MRQTSSLLVALLALFAPRCDSADGAGAPLLVGGVVLHADGREAARVEGGDYTGRLVVAPGGSVRLMARFLARDGGALPPDRLGPAASLGVRVAGAALAARVPGQPVDVLVLEGRRAGTGFLRVELFDGVRRVYVTPEPGFEVVVAAP